MIDTLSKLRQEKGRALRPFFVCCLAVGLPGCAVTATTPVAIAATPIAAAATPVATAATPVATAATPVAAPPATRGGGRIRPPDAVTCDHDHLTSWSGPVSGYRREVGKTWLQISTDDGTVEATTIAHGDQPDASMHYLLWGEAFAAKDFSNIEASPGVLKVGMRVVAWICDDGTTAPVVDWQPPRG